MDGKTISAPASISACAGMGPVLTAMVNICAAVPETTPKGAFSMTIASFALTPALESPIK